MLTFDMMLMYQAEDLFLDGRIGLHTAFSHFKTDLEMSSLTDSSECGPLYTD